MAQPAPKTTTTGLPQMIGLFVFVATAAIFLGALANRVLAGMHTPQEFAVAFSYLVAVVALVVMFVDVYDLWVRGRRFNAGDGTGPPDDRAGRHPRVDGDHAHGQEHDPRHLPHAVDHHLLHDHAARACGLSQDGAGRDRPRHDRSRRDEQRHKSRQRKGGKKHR